MFGNTGKKLSATGRDDAPAPINQPEALPHGANEAAPWKPDQRPNEETERLRESQKNIEAPRDSEARFRAIFENAAVGIARVAPDGRWMEVNQRFCDIVGYDREELMTKTFGDITHPDDLEQDLAALRRMLAGEVETYLREKRYYRKDGSVVWVNLTVSLARTADGAPDYFISLIEDISARKRAEEKLREREERLSLASWASGLGVFEWDVQADCAVWENERMYEIFGHTHADGALSKAQLIERYVLPDDVAAFERALADGMKSGRPFHTVFRIYRKDGAPRWLELAGDFELARDGAPIRMIGMLADITERKLGEEEILKRVALRADVSVALAERKGSLQSMLQKSAEALVRHLGVAFARVWTLNPKESLLELQASAGMYTHLNGAHSRVPVGELKIGLIAKERQPHLTNDVCNDPRVSDKEWAREKGMVAFAGYPLLVEDRVVGVMAMFARHPLTEDTVETIATVAAPIAQGIERKRAEEALRASEEKFRILADTAPVMVWMSGADKLRAFFNKPWLDFTGHTMEEELGAGWTEGVHQEDYDRCLEIYFTSFEAREPFEVEYRLRRYDGEYRWVLDHGVPRYSPGGDFLGYIGSCIDITERRQAEETLRESEARFQHMADTAPAMLWVTKPDGRGMFLSRGWYEFTGQTEQEALGKGGFGWFDAVHPDDRGESGRVFLEANKKREAFTIDYRLRRADGMYRWVIDAGRPRFDKAGDFLGYVGSVFDITERKQAEAEREQLAREQVARAAAEAANRSKDEFLAIVSHELRSPLNAILGYTRMLRSCPVDRESINNVSSIVERNARAQLQIVEDLLDSARIIAGKLRIESGPVDLVPVLEAALDTARSAAEAKGVTLAADFGAMPEQVLGDPTRLQQVVWNLLTNAVKFTPEGGRVELRMEGDADNVRITVSDTGKGIEPEFLPFVFDYFRQADASSARRHGGLGLGLSLVKHLVELHGGTIAAESEGKGRGAAFTVTLPRRQFEFIEAPPRAVAHREVRTEGAITIDRDLSLEGMSVLVVDDQEEARELLVQALGEYGAQATAVSSGVEVLAYLSDPPGGKRPDALILDIAMPDEDGYTVLKKVRALEAARGDAADQIPAIALTAYGRSEDRLRAFQEGFHMHVTKPVEPAELAVIIASVTTRLAWERERKE
jgi:PAS domain S-box-containing protein